MSRRGSFGIGAVACGVVVVGGLIFGAMSIEKIPAGYTGIIYEVNGGVSEETLQQGWHFVSPFKKVIEYSTSFEQSYLTADKFGDSEEDESFTISTSDGKSIRVEMEFSYRFDVDRLPQTFTQFKGRNGDTIKETFIKPKIKAWCQEISATYPSTDVYGDKRQELNLKTEEHLREKFSEYGIHIDSASFTKIDVDDETAKAIQKKVNAQQELELANIEAETAKIQAEKDKEIAKIKAEKDKAVAQIQAEKALIEAKAEADAMTISAEAEAEANKKIAESLTLPLIEKFKYERWNGQLPSVTGSDSIIRIDGFKK